MLLELHSTLRMEVISQHFNVKQGLNSCAVHNVWENMCANKNQNVGVHNIQGVQECSIPKNTKF